MITKYIGVKEFRQNIAKYAALAKRHGWRYVVSSRGEPIFEVKALSQKDAILVKLAVDIAAARRQIRNSKAYTLDQIFQMLKDKRKIK